MLEFRSLSLFITLEGIEGCGKSTQAKRLGTRLTREGYDCVVTREPGGTPIGKKIRQVILNPDHHRMFPETELALYFADRAQHLREVVWPALEARRIVVSDRFTDSTIAYQGKGRGVPLRSIRALDRALTGAFRPDVTLLLDLPAAIGLPRARRRNSESETHSKEGRFEEEALEFHDRVRAAYLAMARREPKRFVVVSAEGAPARVHDALWTALSATKRLPRRRRKKT